MKNVENILSIDNNSRLKVIGETIQLVLKVYPIITIDHLSFKSVLLVPQV